MSEAFERVTPDLAPPGYRLGDVIGRGATGVVLRATDPDARPIALKIARDYQLPMIGHLRAEIALLKRVQHPGIINLRDSGVIRGLPWYTMDLLPTRTLADRCAEAAYDVDAAVALLVRLLETVEAIHARGYLHGDLKPENVFLRDATTPVIGDLDLIREGSRAASLGTPLYAAPEQIRTEPLDARTDLYALGCIAHTLLTGAPPFNDPVTLLIDHLQRPPPNLPVTAALDAIIQRMLAKNRQARPAYAQDVIAELTQCSTATRSSTPRLPHLYKPSLQGRRDLLQAFRRLAAFNAEGGGFLIAGETGIGKSMVAERLASLLDDQGWQSVSATAGSTNPLAPLKPLLQMMVDFAWINGPELAQQMFGADGGALRLYQPSIGELPGITAPSTSHLSVQTGRGALFRDLDRALRTLARQHRVAVIVDDLHLADELTLALLAGLLRNDLYGEGVVFVGLYRPEQGAALSALRPHPNGQAQSPQRLTELSLDPLTDAEISRMVAEMLACDVPPASLTAALSREVQGNPFYVTEYLRMVVERGVLQRTSDGWALAAELPPAPDSLQTLLGERLAGLSSNARDLLEIAALIGRQSSAELLTSAGEAAPAAAQETLDELLRSRMLAQEGAHQLSFRHDGLRRYLLARLRPHPQRSARIASAMENHFFGRPEFPELFEIIAGHWHAADHDAAACTFYQRAGDHALQLAAYRDAERHYARAADLTPEWESAQRGRLLVRVAIAQSSAGRLDQADTTILEALNALGVRVPATRAGWRWALWREVLARAGTPFVRDADPGEPVDDVVNATAFMAERYYFANDLVKMYTMTLMSVNAGNRIDDASNARPYAYLGFAVGTLGLRRRAEHHLGRCHEIASRRNEPADIAYAWLARALFNAGRGFWAAAQRAARAGLADVDERVDPEGFENLTSCLSTLTYYQGDLDKSLALAASFKDLAERRGNDPRQGWAWLFIARVALLRGQAETALTHLDRAAELGGSVRDGFIENMRPGLRALALATLGERDAAAREARDSLTQLHGFWPTNFTLREAYLATASAFRKLGDRTGERDSVAELSRFARRFPMASPIAAAYRLRLSNRELSARRQARLLKRIRQTGTVPDELLIRQWRGTPDPELTNLRHRLDAPTQASY